MAEAAIRLVEPIDVNQKALTYADLVKTLPAITTTEQYVQIGEIWKQGKALLSEIDEGYDDLIKSAHKLHKDALAKKAKYYDPVNAGVRTAKALMSAYDEEQERIRLAEQRRLEEEARKKAEEEALLAAIEAEEEAKRNGATAEEAAAEAEIVMSEPIPVAPVVVPKATPKLAGGPVYQYRWSARVTSIRKLCGAVVAGASEELVMGLAKNPQGDISSPALNQMAVALKQTMNIPGVEAVQRRV